MDDPTFRARLSPESRKHFQYILSYISKFNSDVLLRCTDEGLNIQVADPAHISMINVCLNRDFFDSLVAHGEIGVKVDTFNKILGMMEDNCMMELVNAKLHIKDENTHFEMSCFEIDGEKFEFPAEEIAQMKPVEFFGASTATMIDVVKQWHSKFHIDAVEFNIHEDRLTLSATGMDTNISRNFPILTSEGYWKAKINAKYFTQLPKTSNNITMSWRLDFPVMMEERSRHFTMQTFVAPMMDVEDY